MIQTSKPIPFEDSLASHVRDPFEGEIIRSFLKEIQINPTCTFADRQLREIPQDSIWTETTMPEPEEIAFFDIEGRKIKIVFSSTASNTKKEIREGKEPFKGNQNIHVIGAILGEIYEVKVVGANSYMEQTGPGDPILYLPDLFSNRDDLYPLKKYPS